MHPLNMIIVTAAVGVAACAGEQLERRTSTTTVTAAEVKPLPPPPSALRVNPEARIDDVAPLELWRARYPHAARVLDEWVEGYPDAAARVVAWSVDEPEQLEVLVMWAVTSPHERIETFLGGRTSWTALAELQHEHPRGVDAFVRWVRRARPAAEELAIRPGGLAVVASGPPVVR